MSASIPPAPTLSVKAGDTMNYDGQNYVVQSVGAGSDNGQGLVTYSVVLTAGPTITVAAKNTVLESANNAGVDLWVQNATL